MTTTMFDDPGPVLRESLPRRPPRAGSRNRNERSRSELMSDPFEQLGLPSDADEAEIRRRYLELVRENSPDRAPERFAEIHAAYEAVRDPARRLEGQALRDPCQADSLESVEARLRERLRDARIPVSVLVAWADSA